MRTLRGLTATGIAAVLFLLAGTAAVAAPTAQPFTTDPAVTVVAQPFTTDDVEPAIVGGRPATEQYPAVAAQITHPGDTRPHYCSASLHDAFTVVIAAHCVTGPDAKGLPVQGVRLRIGSTDRTTGGYERGATRITPHPTWNWARTPGEVGDLAVVRLDQPVPVRSMPVAPRLIGAHTRIVGWGLTTIGGTSPPAILHELDTTILPPAACTAGTRTITVGELCISHVTGGGGGAGACHGDSGGPAMQRSPYTKRWVAVGTASRLVGTVCGTGPAIYTDLTVYRQWILRASLTLVIPGPNPPRVSDTQASPDLHWLGGQPIG